MISIILLDLFMLMSWLLTVTRGTESWIFGLSKVDGSRGNNHGFNICHCWVSIIRVTIPSLILLDPQEKCGMIQHIRLIILCLANYPFGQMFFSWTDLRDSSHADWAVGPTFILFFIIYVNALCRLINALCKQTHFCIISWDELQGFSFTYVKHKYPDLF